jgi:hypothetical protein
LKTALAKPECLLDDQKREVRTFVLTLTKSAGSKRGQGRGSFVLSVLDLIDDLYSGVVQSLKPWTPAPRRLPEPPSPVRDQLDTATSNANPGGEPPVHPEESSLADLDSAIDLPTQAVPTEDRGAASVSASGLVSRRTAE